MTGRTIGRFEILEKLGEGGMGVVLKARDTRLDRFVAVKVLAIEKVADPERKRRFTQEAKAASALNHPNIVAIYDIDQSDGIDFIAMEFVPGKSLDHLIRRKGLRPHEALKYSIQIADALAATHAAGIVHRDLKPGNVMVMENGLVKVVDFGLAKLDEPVEKSQLSSTETIVRSPRTEEGTIIGTAAYMSPEQAEGRPADARSDIFSFGSLLYEMVTGQRAFQGQSQMSVLAKILREEPKPVSEIAPLVPPELGRLIGRCLRKDPARRFQHMSDLKVALEELCDESGSQPALVPSRRRIGRLVTATLAALGMVALVIGTVVYLRNHRSSAASSLPVRLTLESGTAGYPAISLDGKLIAYASDRGGNFDIYVQQIGGKNPIRVTSSPFDEIDPSFTPDATQIVYFSKQDGGGIYVVPTLGGEPRLLASHGYDPRVSPDGVFVAYSIARLPPYISDGDQIAVIPISGGSARVIHPELQAGSPIWSPDGKYLVFVALANSEDYSSENRFDWWVAPVQGGPAVKTGTSRLLSAAGQYRTSLPVFWRANMVYGSVRIGDSTNLWAITLSPETKKAQGPALRLTDSTQAEDNFSISENGSIVSSSTLSNEDIYSLPLDAERGKVTGPLRRLTQELSQETYPTASADGAKLTYQSDRSGQLELWVRDLATGRENALAPLTTGMTTTSVISPDGSQVAYTVIGENSQLYVMSTSGGAPRLICDHAQAISWSPGDRSLIVQSYENRVEGYAARLELSTGKKVRLPIPVESQGVASLDERWVAFVEQDRYHSQIFIRPLTQQVPPREQWISIAEQVPGVQALGWSPQGRFLYWFSDQDGRDCLYGRPLDAVTKRPVGPAVTMQHLHERNRISSFYSLPMMFNAHQLLLPMVESRSSIWMRRLPAIQ